MALDITGSIVLYKTNREVLNNTINCFLNSSLTSKLYLIDNSPTDELGEIGADDRIKYIFNNANIGYGRAHNIAIRRAINSSKYHLVINPDVEFEGCILEDIFQYMEQHSEIGQLLPLVLYKDGRIQKLCKLLPSPVDLLGRRFFKSRWWATERNKRYEINEFPYDRCLNVPNLSGCFMFFRNTALKKVGGFDARYFMYLEDIDITRRIHRFSKTVFYPYATIYHGFEKGSYSNIRLLIYHIISTIKYFNKWGWIFDKERDEINCEVLRSIKLDKIIESENKP